MAENWYDSCAAVWACLRKLDEILLAISPPGFERIISEIDDGLGTSDRTGCSLQEHE